MELSFKPRNGPRVTPSLEPCPDQAKSINELSIASSQAETLNRVAPVPQREPGLDRVQYLLRSRLSQDERTPEPIPSWAGIDSFPVPGRVRTKPSGIRAPSEEPSLGPRPSLASKELQVSRRVSKLSRAELRVKHRADPRAEMPIRASNYAEQSTEPRA